MNGLTLCLKGGKYHLNLCRYLDFINKNEGYKIETLDHMVIEALISYHESSIPKAKCWVNIREWFDI